ncbi:MAG: translation initiation factor IF-2 [Thaumarchaeota archaeon]|nr:translation initiation factor IF-2 [Candidatus Calditenuaceae archaeon]MDW8186558.1 translation initiation factor IF-2 [Nitrososphaerota archaeon]
MVERWVREPIVVVLGHVDHGKTSLLDRMRGTIVAAREAGGITQHIGASFFPYDAIVETCRRLLGEVRAEIRLPGLLFIDTPGHAAFANLRRRGGSVADMAILVVDVIQGVQEQTVESLQLLRSRRTPFVVALNKIDMIPGWRPVQGAPLKDTLPAQPSKVVEDLERRLYSLVGELSKYGFTADLYTRIKDFTRTLAIVPVSARTGEGVPDLLLLMMGLAQVYMSRKLEVSEDVEGVVLEVVEETGLGATANVILSSGVLREGDRIAMMGKRGPVATRVRALLLPKPLDEMRDPKDFFKRVQFVRAAAGVKVVAEGLEEVYPGSPLFGLRRDEDLVDVVARLREELEEFKVTTDKVGVIAKADTLGSLEVLVNYLRERGVPIRLADIGGVSKRDIVEAEVVHLKDKFLGNVIAFNVDVDERTELEANSKGIRVFKGNVLFRLVDEYLNWVAERRREEEEAEFGKLVKPGKIKFMEGFVFRRSDPAIFGVEVLAGEIATGVRLVNSVGRSVGEIHQIQEMGRPLSRASSGMKVAISIRGVTVGRQVKEGETLYVGVPERDARLLITRFTNRLDEQSLRALEELTEVMRKVNPLWAR